MTEYNSNDMFFDAQFSGEDVDFAQYDEDFVPTFDDEYPKILFYGKRADKSDEEYEAMPYDEKLEYLMLKFRPLCLKLAKKYRYECAEFQDMYMEACLHILEVVDEYGIDNKDLCYRILSNVGIKVKRKADDDKKESGHLSYDDDKICERVENATAAFDSKTEYAELFDELASYLSGQELEIAKQLCINGGQSAVSLARDFDVCEKTMRRKLENIREKLEPLRRRLHKQGFGNCRRKSSSRNFVE